MQEEFLFEYAVIRLIPRVERSEFLNIGVLLFCAQKRFLDLKFRLDEVKINAFCPNLDLAFIQKQLKAFEHVSKGTREGGIMAQQSLSYRFRWLSANRSTIIQFSRAHPGFCKDPAQTLLNLYEQQVL